MLIQIIVELSQIQNFLIIRPITEEEYIASNNNTFRLNNIKILNNITKEGSGGGIYAYGDLTIDGDKSSISNNTAETWGGGIIVKTKTIINNCIICNNKAMKNSGEGIQVDGELYLNKTKIYKNWCNQNGGGISYLPS